MTSAGKSLRIAVLTHSTNPRGGVVHALELADGLARLGHEAVVHAPDPKNTGFFRESLTEPVCIQASPATGLDVAQMVEARIADYVRHFEVPQNRSFDIFHAQDSISGNALAVLKKRGLIGKFARTVHHIDGFRDDRLQKWQTHSIAEADELFVVSRFWRDRISDDFDRRATLVGNGVDLARFSSLASGTEQALRERLGLSGGPILLCVGGIEERKNTNRILAAFQQIQTIHRDAQLVIAGGASLLDHSSYRRDFESMLSGEHLTRSVHAIGLVPDIDMPVLYRLADVLVFPSVKEGFGLAVLEAMASGVPVVTSRIEPFTEYLSEDDAVWCDPLSEASIANAIATSLTEPLRSRLVRRGRVVAEQHDWTATAHAHLPVYENLLELQHA